MIYRDLNFESEKEQYRSKKSQYSTIADKDSTIELFLADTRADRGGMDVTIDLSIGSFGLSIQGICK